MRALFALTFILLCSSWVLAGDSDCRTSTVLTQAQQAALSPGEVQAMLAAGNQRFVAGDLTCRDHSAQVRDAAQGQFPKAVALSCVDSRIPVEDVFDLGIGDMFVARVAGNFVNVDILGSMEFATKVSGAKLILVLGHKDCGAIKAAIDKAQLGNITAMLENIAPAVDAASGYKGEKSSSNPDYVQLVTKNNVLLAIDDIRARSPVLKAMADAGAIEIVGGIYDMKTGAVELLD